MNNIFETLHFPTRKISYSGMEFGESVRGIAEVIQSQIWVISDYLNERGGCSSREAVHSTIANRYWLTESAPNDKRLSISFFCLLYLYFCSPICFCWMDMLSTIHVSGVVRGLMN